MNRSSAESAKDDVHAERMDLGRPIHAQRNEHIRMHQLRLSGSGIEHDERSDPRAGEEETSGLGGVQEHRMDVVKKTRNTWLCAHLFDTTVLPALTYASETWAFRKQEENAVSVIERAIERVMLGLSRFTQMRDGIRSSLLRQRSKRRRRVCQGK
ncbi:hypothetical protein RB195_004462 [Necator americanus]|uniref:Uncharacterized protein n=1 Tax=Necator americanus TaxID=51031 RepID=A0ABR1BI34_NECAM